MKYILILLLFVASSVKGQYSPFRALPKPVKSFSLSVSPDSTSAGKTSINAFRFLPSVAAYTIPGSLLMTGIGYGFQHLTYSDSTNKWYAVYSISAFAWAGGQTQPTVNPYNIMSYGIMIGALNNTILIGAAYNDKKVVAVASIGISINN